MTQNSTTTSGNTSIDSLPELINMTIMDSAEVSSDEEDPFVEEIRDEEFPSYFTERKGRLFCSGNSMYPLPVDTPEQERQALLHEVLRQLHGANYFGPVNEVLTPITHRKLEVLDACTGKGQWALDMAKDFPHVHFIGFDQVPVATRYPPANVQFEIHDVNALLRWADGYFDVVHLRGVSLAVHSFQNLLTEVSRVVRQGGLLLSSEWDNNIYLDPASGLNDISTHAPASCRFHRAVGDALSSRHHMQSTIGPVLTETGEWVNIVTSMHYVPILHQDPGSIGPMGMGQLNCAAHEMFATSIRQKLAESGHWTEVDLDIMINGYIAELRSKTGLASILHTVQARKT